jgi:predicted metal-binding membrane protein
MNDGAIAAVLRRDNAVVLSALAAVIAVAWGYLLLGAGIHMEAMDMGGGHIMAMLPEWTLGYAAIVFVMWAVMMVAMMLPSAAPVVLLAASLDRQHGASAGRSTLFAAGYLVVWLGFSLGATALQYALDMAGLLSESMGIANRLLAAGVLVAAGIYQWTPLKQTCLTRCRSPIELLVRYWRKGSPGAIIAGVEHGAFCLGCCWMLMALLFVGGLMNLAWIAAIALLVLIEKTLPWGGRMSRVAGGVLVAWGAAATGTAL